jgi:CBS domain-containing protein
MQISDVMTRSVITAPPDMSLALAQRLMADHRIRHLPVVQAGQLVGLVSDRDIRQALPSPTTTLTQTERTYKLGTLAIATCMTREVVTVPPEADLVQGIRQLLAGPYGCLPVLAGQQLVGIVTAIDVLRGVLIALGSVAARRPVRAYMQLSLSRFMVHDASEARRPPRWLVDSALACSPARVPGDHKVTVDEVQHLVPSFEAALQAQMACGRTLHHVRMPLTRCQPVVKSG